MAELTIHNLTKEPLYLGELYTSVPTNAPLVIYRPAPALKHLTSLKRALEAEQVAFGIVYTAGEVQLEDPFAGAEESHAARKTWEVR
jgi:hypothetical protein